MRLFLTFTDTNSRQYPIEVKGDGIAILCGTENYIFISREHPSLTELLSKTGKVVVDHSTLINLDYITAIQLQEYAE